VVALDRQTLFSLEGRTAVITGAAGFLGRTMTRTLLENGARVVALGRSARLLDAAAGWRGEFGDSRVAAHHVDMYDLDALRGVLQRIADAEASVDVLINNAHELGPPTGFNVSDGRVEASTIDQWQRNFAGGVYWPLLAAQTLGKRMTEARRGSIINVSTMYAQVAPNPLLYEGTSGWNPPARARWRAVVPRFRCVDVRNGPRARG